MFFLAVIQLTAFYTVGQKSAPFYFCNIFVKTFYIKIIIGTYILR